MRTRMLTVDGFEKSIAEKMPKMKKLEESVSPDPAGEVQALREEQPEGVGEVKAFEGHSEKVETFEPKRLENEQTVDVLRLIEDLHGQLLASARAKRALEIDLQSQQKTIHQMSQDNQELRRQLEDLRKELQRVKETQAEAAYLKEENEDALEKIEKLRQELREANEALLQTTRERDEALSRVQDLSLQLQQAEILQIKGRLKEREASHFYEENQSLQSKLEEVLAQNIELERRCETLKKSFDEVRESLTFLRDSCKKEYYNLSETAE
ncbi:MAG: hypothetical protein HXY46_06275 [Syntrophaceae bacterium]|nr:hypothetical protein [Syntrophaceae bacterium]